MTTSFQARTHLDGTFLDAAPHETGARRSGRVLQADVLKAAAAGDAEAHAKLYDALYPFVAAALQRLLHQTPDYEDLVQTTFEQVIRSLRKERQIENLAAWSSAIAVRVSLSYLRVQFRERRIFVRHSEPPDVAGGEVERQLHARSELRWLQEALAAIHPEQAEAVLLHDVLGYDLFEVAHTMDVSLAAAQKRLSRGHIALRRRADARAKGGRQ